MALISQLRGRLAQGQLAAAARAAAEAALVSEAHDLLMLEDYGGAASLLASFELRAENGAAIRQLRLVRATLLAHAGDHGGAAALVSEVASGLESPAGRSELLALARLYAAREEEGAERGGAWMAAQTGEANSAPERVEMSVYPNPFNPVTMVSLSIPQASYLRAEVFDVLGRRVQVLSDARVEAGQQALRFDGSRVASGAYFLRVLVEPEHGEAVRMVRRLTLLK
jgi:hypothetical protein